MFWCLLFCLLFNISYSSTLIFFTFFCLLFFPFRYCVYCVATAQHPWSSRANGKDVPTADRTRLVSFDFLFLFSLYSFISIHFSFTWNFVVLCLICSACSLHQSQSGSQLGPWLILDGSDTQSLTASVTDYPVEHGRRYHKYHEGGRHSNFYVEPVEDGETD